MATYLDRILAWHRERAAEDPRDFIDVARTALACPPARDFAAALRGHDRMAVIAEVKRRSPSKGDLNAGLDPALLAAQYAAGGAAALSVLTDEPHFGGSAADLEAARNAVKVPVLRKDFTVSRLDVCDARLMGADCVLLIAAALSDEELGEFHALALDLGLAAVVEIHDEVELERALAVGARLVGVNQRDLVTFEVDHERATRMGELIPSHVVRIAESGVRDVADARSLRDAGYDAVLVGETLVTSGDPRRAVEELRVSD